MIKCLEHECNFIYYGETNRNGFSRGGEHLKDSLSKTVDGIEKSIIANHSWLHHEGKKIKVSMKMENKYRCDPTGRQNAEAILIRNAPADLLINSKAEHIQPCDVKERYEKSSGLYEEAKLEKRTKVEKLKLRSKIKTNLERDFIFDNQLIDHNNYQSIILIPKVPDAMSPLSESRILRDMPNQSSQAPTFPSTKINEIFENIKAGNNPDDDHLILKTENAIPLASNIIKVSSTTISDIAAGKNQDKATQGVKRSRKATGHPIQSNKISSYFLKYN